MRKEYLVFFELIRSGLFPKSEFEIKGLTQADVDWTMVYKLAQRHQVYPIVYNGLQVLYNRVSKEETFGSQYPAIMDFYSKSFKKLKVEWMGKVFAEKEYFEKQYRVISELGDLWSKSGLRPVVIKGMAHAQYYPDPSLRISTDIDTFFPKEWEQSNSVIEELGVTIDRDYYKNSTFTYKEIIVENHHFCTQVRGSKRRKQYERYLQSLLDTSLMNKVMDTEMFAPPPMFTALYFISHAQTHFIMDGGINLKHICDWGILMNAFSDKLDWNEFDRQCKTYGMNHFAWAMSYVSNGITGVEIPYECPKIKEEVNALIREIMVPRRKAVDHSSGKISVWLQVVANFLHSGWKYRMFSDQGMYASLFQTVRAFIMERTPHI